MKVIIQPNDKGNPPGKLADVELHFEPRSQDAHGAWWEHDGILGGCKLIGFSVWARRGASGGYNVTFPARSYSVNGERRSFALLRPITDSTATNAIRDRIIEAYQEWEANQQPPTGWQEG